MRAESRQKAHELLKEGKYELAKRKFAESIDITPKIAHQLIRHLKRMGVEYYVAPYEADAQLMYMWKEGYADVIITEDSDLLAYGCEKVFFKMDSKGYGYEVDIRNIGLITKPSFCSFTREDFVKTCILSGCDYIESIKGVGFKKAHKYMQKMKERGLKYIIHEFRRKPNFQVPHDYEHQFNLARLTFKYQLVYCPRREQIVHLNEPEDDLRSFLENISYNNYHKDVTIKKTL